MLKMMIEKNDSVPFKVLCRDAHCMTSKSGAEGQSLNSLAVTSRWRCIRLLFCSDPARTKETTAASDLFLRGASQKHVVIRDFRDGFLPFGGVKIKEMFGKLNENPSPDLIFSHYRDDRHQDYRLISDLAWDTWRDHLILEYEIPEY